jgi:hypothetical protein
LTEINIINVKSGNSQVDKIYSGTNLIFEKAQTDTTAPTTSIRPYDAINNPTNTYDSAQTVYLDTDEMADTYYTTDGSTPTTASAHYEGGGFLISSTKIVKYFSVDQLGNTETVKSLIYTINIATGWRYVRFVGHGDNTSTTTRLVELRAIEGATNRLLNKTPMAGYPAVNGGAIGVATDGAKVHAPGYPLWWTGEGVPDMVYDMGANYPITSINVCGYSPVADPRQTQFKIYVSTDNLNWTLVQDYSANTTIQPEDGFYFNVP